MARLESQSSVLQTNSDEKLGSRTVKDGGGRGVFVGGAIVRVPWIDAPKTAESTNKAGSRLDDWQSSEVFAKGSQGLENSQYQPWISWGQRGPSRFTHHAHAPRGLRAVHHSIGATNVLVPPAFVSRVPQPRYPGSSSSSHVETWWHHATSCRPDRLFVGCVPFISVSAPSMFRCLPLSSLESRSPAIQDQGRARMSRHDGVMFRLVDPISSRAFVPLREATCHTCATVKFARE